MDKNIENIDATNAALPNDWFLTEEEEAGKIIDEKGWVYRKYQKKHSVPCLIFPV
jgi:hypothetical protein